MVSSAQRSNENLSNANATGSTAADNIDRWHLAIEYGDLCFGKKLHSTDRASRLTFSLTILTDNAISFLIHNDPESNGKKLKKRVGCKVCVCVGGGGSTAK